MNMPDFSYDWDGEQEKQWYESPYQTWCRHADEQGIKDSEELKEFLDKKRKRI